MTTDEKQITDIKKHNTVKVIIIDIRKGHLHKSQCSY